MPGGDAWRGCLAGMPGGMPGAVAWRGCLAGSAARVVAGAADAYSASFWLKISVGANDELTKKLNDWSLS